MAGDRIGELKKRVEDQCKALIGLAESLEGEDRLRQLMSGLKGSVRETLSSLVAGGASGKGFALSWPETRSLFLDYLEFKHYEPAIIPFLFNSSCSIMAHALHTYLFAFLGF